MALDSKQRVQILQAIDESLEQGIAHLAFLLDSFSNLLADSAGQSFYVVDR